MAVPIEGDANPSQATHVDEPSEITPSVGRGVVYAAYSKEFFVPNRLAKRITEILKANRGGNYGLTGPRGAGKSWIMQYAKEEAEDRGGLGLWFPSPTEEKPDAFLAAISDVLAQRYIHYYLEKTPSSTIAGRQRRRFTLLLLATITYVGIALVFAGTTRVALHFSGLTWIGIALSLAGFLGAVALVFSRRFVGAETTLYEKALEVSRQARYAAAFSDSQEYTGAVGKGAATLGLTRKSQSNFTERPPTLSTLVHSFREFAQEIAQHMKGPLLIAIDELDKMESRKEVLALLRGIKGIFDVPQVHYFVSVSDEAARQLDLGAITGRNEFNSSFYQVFALPRADTAHATALLEARGLRIDPSTITVLTVMSGGVPREMIRQVDCIMECSETDSLLHEASSPELTLLTAEVMAFASETYRMCSQNGDRKVSFTDIDKFFVHRALLPKLVSREVFASTDFMNYWDLEEQSCAWREQFGEKLRGMLVRLGIGVVLTQRPALDKDAVALLQQVVELVGLDAAVARDLFMESGLRKAG